ncbi:ABC transporter substrate-binding protein [Salinispira pacifica]|uniref:ABC transporter substrate-binding protein n=1 Tax=Salinispira pacifica TaxID=1307761 RepID=UPI001FCA9F62|nr:ABC transporter substrate-binding protein [Salinispira pacifica]
MSTALFASAGSESTVGGLDTIPQRIIALDPFTFEAMVALEAPIIATSRIYIEEFLQKFPEYEEQLQSVVRLELPADPEILLSLEPDAILGRRTAIEGSLRRLSRIAPTVVFANESSADWQESAAFFAAAIGMTTEFDLLDSRFRDRLALLQIDLRRRYGDDLPTVSLLRIMPGRLRLYFTKSFAGIVIDGAGLSHPDHQQELIDRSGRGASLYNLSLEELRLADADYVFAYTTEGLGDDEAQRYLNEVREQSLWASLDAVKNNRVFIVENNWFAAGYIAADAIIDDLYQHILDTGASALP